MEYNILYVGSACGAHIILLHKMFPNLKFILVDPRPFNTKLIKLSRVKYINKYFNNEMAKKFKKINKNLIFISDIRTISNEQNVPIDMEYQQNWVKIINPLYSLLKFRLPWSDKNIKYLDGTIYLQAWQSKNSTETRLLVKRNAKLRTYDTKLYENKLYYHNMINRCKYYKYKENEINDWNKIHMDNCYDCTIEKLLHDRYLNSKFNVFPKDFTPLKLSKLLNLVLTNCVQVTRLKNHWNYIINNFNL